LETGEVAVVEFDEVAFELIGHEANSSFDPRYPNSAVVARELKLVIDSVPGLPPRLVEFVSKAARLLGRYVNSVRACQSTIPVVKKFG
jgi:hypothetical protein